jgi:hypothetical protein
MAVPLLAMPAEVLLKSLLAYKPYGCEGPAKMLIDCEKLDRFVSKKSKTNPKEAIVFCNLAAVIFLFSIRYN